MSKNWSKTSVNFECQNPNSNKSLWSCDTNTHHIVYPSFLLNYSLNPSIVCALPWSEQVLFSVDWAAPTYVHGWVMGLKAHRGKCSRTHGRKPSFLSSQMISFLLAHQNCEAARDPWGNIFEFLNYSNHHQLSTPYFYFHSSHLYKPI